MSSKEERVLQSEYDESQYYPRVADESETDSGGTLESLDEETPIPINQETLSSPPPPPPPSKELTDKEAPSKETANDKEDIKGIVASDTQTKDVMSCGVCFQLLLDPVTLNCGHSFCLVCLAQLWNVSRNSSLLCPMCRQPWAEPGGRLPSVNVMLREVLEQTFPEKIKERRGALSPEEFNLIVQYNQGSAQRPGMGSGRERRQVNMHAIICIFMTVLCSIFLLVFFAVSISLWLVGGVGDHYMRKPVLHWTNDDVMEWFEGLGDTVIKDSREIFESEKFDGRHLLRLTDNSLKEYGLSSETSRNSLLLSIEQLKEKQRALPRNFHEFMEANKEDTVLILLTYKVFPRLTFGYLYLFRYYTIFLPVVQVQLLDREKEDTPLLTSDEENIKEIEDESKRPELIQMMDQRKTETEKEEVEDGKSYDGDSRDISSTQLIAIFLEILLVPHLVVAMYTLTGLQSEPFLSLIILFHCIVATLREVKNLRNKLRTRPAHGQTSIWSWIKTGLFNCLFYIILLMIGQTICFLFPYPLLTFTFYVLIFQTLYSLLHRRFFLPIFQSVGRFGAHGFVQFLNNNR
ncbi:PREDICTED: bifunctional apoptosis regulator-like [Amphimedon queenslandica]|uniref:RING-type domain-containing protein n=1 Tax=Amphimedon queenslandica TaxID=400682 RepID=A0A1X7VU65_AMPQE|nr:PREDICTED: bifunctional apoptosis regulator-like [Amphimedon queenslandica]|eukprot:XP_019853147.1 PREDICTED: bifunctional apoptosis regulator-like [Amphimedon queenslandica]